jgi:hypothetical protein
MFSLLFGPCFFSLSVFLHVSSYCVCFLFFPLCFSTFSPFCVVMLLVASQYHSQVFALLWDFLLILSMQVSGYTGLYPLPGADEVSGEVVIDKLLSYMLLLMVPEQVRDCHCRSYCMCVFVCLCFLLHSSFIPFVLLFLPNSVSPYLEVFL